MARGRKYGLLLVVLGAIGIAAGWYLAGFGLDFGEAILVGGAAFLPAGVFLLVFPGPDLKEHHDFADWFESLPTKNKVGVYACAGLGVLSGGAYALWSLGAGVFW